MTADIAAVNRALDRLVPAADGKYAIVKEAMRYSLEAGGKRIRPILTLAFARAAGGQPEQALPLACAVEMVHTYSLIHDDLPCMDDDDLRRGKPSCHVAFGEANALLAGDGLLTLAFATIAKAPASHRTSPAAALRAAGILADCAGVNGMVGGQVMDLSSEGKLVDGDTLREICRLKTAALLEAACRMGVVSANGGEKLEKLAAAYAQKLGLAFQIVDDILDVTGEEASLGKPIGSDAEQRKCTYVTLYGLDEAKRQADAVTAEAMDLLAQLPKAEFLMELTQMLLERRS